jgi:hypothetical protein
VIIRELRRLGYGGITICHPQPQEPRPWGM